jgi:hypothetical protein
VVFNLWPAVKRDASEGCSSTRDDAWRYCSSVFGGEDRLAGVPGRGRRDAEDAKREADMRAAGEEKDRELYLDGKRSRGVAD